MFSIEIFLFSKELAQSRWWTLRNSWYWYNWIISRLTLYILVSYRLQRERAVHGSLRNGEGRRDKVVQTCSKDRTQFGSRGSWMNKLVTYNKACREDPQWRWKTAHLRYVIMIGVTKYYLSCLLSLPGDVWFPQRWSQCFYSVVEGILLFYNPFLGTTVAMELRLFDICKSNFA